MNYRFRVTTGVALAVVSASAFVSCEHRPQTASCRVKTPNGEVRGVDLGVSCAFLGIPFAVPPRGNLRWKPPQPASDWAPGILDANVTPPSCPVVDPPGTGETKGSEDCLKLNIWTPKPASTYPVPVIVWIDGGDFIAASATRDGQLIAEETRAIVVSVNYRVGPLGFLGHTALTAEDRDYPSSANYGLLDQRAAFGWILDHIDSFGGDPASVTIAGQFAGAESVGLHLVSPGSARYFNRAIMQSGFASSRWRTLAEAESVGDSFAASLGCTDPPNVLECMRSKTTEQVLLALPSGPPQFTETVRAPWGPVVDGLEIPDQPRTLYSSGAFNRMPVMIGATGEQGWTLVDRAFPTFLSAEVYQAEVEAEFGSPDTPAILERYPVAGYVSPKHALSKLAGDVEAVCEARRVARLISRRNSPVYLYSLERDSHSAAAERKIGDPETHFVFASGLRQPSSHVEGERTLWNAISRYWTGFAATGNPNSDEPGIVQWPAFRHAEGEEKQSDRYLVFDEPIHGNERAWYAGRCDFWEPFFLRSVAGAVPAAQP
jgi:para-nitrobenzyl esterase